MYWNKAEEQKRTEKKNGNNVGIEWKQKRN